MEFDKGYVVHNFLSGLAPTLQALADNPCPEGTEQQSDQEAKEA